MKNDLVAKAVITIQASKAKVWTALVDPKSIKQYMFGTNVVSEWKEGGPIYWKGEWQGKSYEDKGILFQIKLERLLQYSHFSPLSGLPDQPENYHTVTVALNAEGGQTQVVLMQDNNPDEKSRLHSEKNWGVVLNGLKNFVEGRVADFSGA